MVEAYRCSSSLMSSRWMLPMENSMWKSRESSDQGTQDQLRVTKHVANTNIDCDVSPSCSKQTV